MALEIALDEVGVAVALSWTAYAGEADFSAYVLLRKVSGLERSDTLAVIADVTVTSFVDTTIHGNTDYFYAVKVITDAGEEVTSDERLAPRLHRLVASWPLDVAGEEYVRLHWDEDGQLAALVSGTSNIRLTLYDRGEGSAQGLFDFGAGQSVDELSGSIAVDDEGFIYVADPGNGRIQKFAP